MEYRVIVGPRTWRDVDEIVRFIAQDSPAAAHQWYEEIFDRFESLESMPERCPVAPEPELDALGIRQMVVGNYRILFTIARDRSAVHIHHVRHAARKPMSSKDITEEGED